MKGKLQLKLAIREGILQGRTQEQIAERLNVSVSTVYREVKKMREGSFHWMTDLAERNFVSTYKDALDGFQDDLVQLYDLLEDPTIKDNPELKLQIRKQISVVRGQRLHHLLRGPMVWSLEVFRKKYATSPIPHPTMKSLGDITGVNR